MGKIVQAPQMVVETIAPAPIMSAPIVETFAPAAFAPSYATAPLVGSISAPLVGGYGTGIVETFGAPLVGGYGTGIVGGGIGYGSPVVETFGAGYGTGIGYGAPVVETFAAPAMAAVAAP